MTTTSKVKWVPQPADASRWLGVKVAMLREATPGQRIQSPEKPNRFATFFGTHPRPDDWLGESWWLLEEVEVTA